MEHISVFCPKMAITYDEPSALLSWSLSSAHRHTSHCCFRPPPRFATTHHSATVHRSPKYDPPC